MFDQTAGLIADVFGFTEIICSRRWRVWRWARRLDAVPGIPEADCSAGPSEVRWEVTITDLLGSKTSFALLAARQIDVGGNAQRESDRRRAWARGRGDLGLQIVLDALAIIEGGFVARFAIGGAAGPRAVEQIALVSTSETCSGERRARRSR